MKNKRQKLKIGISCHASLGGSGIVATELGIALAKRGHEVHFVTHQLPYRLRNVPEGIYCHVVEPINYPVLAESPYFLAVASRICEVVEEHNIRIWHAHYAIPHAMIALLAKNILPTKHKFCLITTLHGTDITIVGADPSLYRITRYTMEQSCAITAVSDWLKEQTIKEFELTKPICRIYNFIDTSKYSRNSPDIKKIPTSILPYLKKDAKVIMHTSNFRAVKRVTDVIRVFAKILEKIDAILIMVGEGPEKASSVSVARQLKVLDKIKYLGNYPNIEELLRIADLVIQPSEYESFSMSALEAMAMGVPVIGTKSGGITEVVIDNLTGILCEVGDIESMASHAIEILTNTRLMRKLSKNAIKHVKENFSSEKIVPLYENLYLETLDKFHS
ncbi:MAG: N-acetyl-alpha-D-glucosaminyl L-malate synthase BshA [Candidatus Hydrogenedentes bacterium]|nr:N-acetyl-alpha-D-glucosaminyl L-malate synthase BshA [Candidatus Hydrogenedentota bacterium]